jgi:hypothetical protein
MSYHPDLSTYIAGQRELPNVRNVGWLDRQHSFPTGEVTALARARLRRLAKDKYTNQSRGFHYCEFCSEEEHRVDGVLLGSAEIWIPTDAGGYYAAPDLIVHYIESHAYQPPSSYLEALGRLDIDEWSPPEDFIGFLTGNDAR